MLTVKEREKLKSLLAHAVMPDEAMSVDQLEGYLFGIVITPEVTQPNEWFADIFGDALASFVDEQEANIKFSPLMEAFNRLKRLCLKGALHFPFELTNLDSSLLDRVRNWAVGFDKALALRSYLWIPEEVLEQEEISEENEEVMTCLMIVLGVAHPEQIPEIFEFDGEQGMDERALWSDLVGQMPEAVRALQAHAQLLEERRLTGESNAAPVSSTQNISSNHSCPCRSGKTYEKCCGLN